ncbi:MAG: chorismate synthase [Lachnospiraceae bacterium]|nr:chorismate synthase [Lachnospiraceae bacterium]
MSTDFGSRIRLSVFGESHAPAVGVVLEGVPAGETIDFEELQAFLARRAPGQSALTTARKEADVPEFLSGIVNGVTCGSAITAVIRNSDTRSADYENLKIIPRPGHADYPAYVKYGGHNDIRGGGQFSARLTAPLCIAGGILLQILERRGIYIGAHIAEIAGIKDQTFDASFFDSIAKKPFPVVSDEAGAAMQEAILAAKKEGDSVGGIVECVITGLAPGLGDPLYGSFEGILSQAVFGIPAVKGIEFGAGFEAARLRGSQNNDAYCIDEAGQIRTVTNNHGGILGGLTSGMPVIFRAAFKPTPSIAKPQQSVDLKEMKETELVIQGRHDPCVVPRAVPCVIAAAAVSAAQIVL